MQTNRIAFAAILAAALLTTACPPVTVADAGVDAGSMTVSALAPNNGSFLDTTAVNVAGTGFVAPVRIWVQNTEATDVVVVNGIRISAKVPPPAAGAAGTFDVKITNGTGQTVTLKGGFSWRAPSVSVDCNLQWPYNMTDDAGSPSDIVYGHITIKGVTDTGKPPVGVDAQLGYGPTGSNPDGDWNWGEATWNNNCTTCSGSAEYSATYITDGTNPTWDYTYRFSYNSGDFIYCDQNGVTDGGTSAGVGHQTVNGKSAPPDAGPVNTDAGAAPTYCTIKYPPLLPTDGGMQSKGTATETVYGRVYVAEGVTGTATQPAGVVAQLGFGPQGSAPASGSGWVWKNATWNSSCGCDPNNSEYFTTMTAPNNGGTYNYAFRFNYKGSAYAYCTTTDNPSDGGVSSDYGVLSVAP